MSIFWCFIYQLLFKVNFMVMFGYVVHCACLPLLYCIYIKNFVQCYHLCWQCDSGAISFFKGWQKLLYFLQRGGVFLHYGRKFTHLREFALHLCNITHVLHSMYRNLLCGETDNKHLQHVDTLCTWLFNLRDCLVAWAQLRVASSTRCSALIFEWYYIVSIMIFFNNLLVK